MALSTSEISLRAVEMALLAPQGPDVMLRCLGRSTCNGEEGLAPCSRLPRGRCGDIMGCRGPRGARGEGLVKRAQPCSMDALQRLGLLGLLLVSSSWASPPQLDSTAWGGGRGGGPVRQASRRHHCGARSSRHLASSKVRGRVTETEREGRASARRGPTCMARRWLASCSLVEQSRVPGVWEKVSSGGWEQAGRRGQPQVRSRKALLVAPWAANPLPGSGSSFPLLAGRVLWDTRDAPAV